ncbi:MAG: BtpA/SgcQ family protein [Bacteroidota bacterium]
MPLSHLFQRPKPIIGVLHVGPSPGVTGARPVHCSVDRTVAEARLLIEHGVDGLLVENMHDVPADANPGPEVTAFLTRAAADVKRYAGRWMPVGVRAMGGANHIALAAAVGASCDFIRVDGWTESTNDAGHLLRLRHALGADALPILADLRPENADDCARLVSRAIENRADGFAVLGQDRSQPPEPDCLDAVLDRTELPVLVGGGLDSTNLLEFVDLADGFLVGSGLKEGANWRAPVCEERVRALVGAVEYARGQEVAS